MLSSTFPFTRLLPRTSSRRLLHKYTQPHHQNLLTSDQNLPKQRTMAEFEDLLPVMAEKLGGEGLIAELCNGFRLLMDKDKGVITLESLRANSALLGLQGLTDGELAGMLREGDSDGDGALNQMEFCVLMFRLSPDLMEDSQMWLEEALEEEIKRS